MENEQSDLFPNFFDNLFPPNNIDEEPLYVNAKQYFRILKRRVARTRLEEVHRLSRQRKPYLHESRHKHAMRRPRGPGGRFLTAEEIAAQKTSAEGPSIAEHDVDDDNLHLSPDPDPEQSPVPSPPPPSSYIQQQQQNMDYHRRHLPISLSTATPPPPPQRQTPPLYPPQSQHQHQHQHHSHSSSSKGTMNSAPITLSSPYPASLQMHHVPHPHAHARHHHSNFSYQMYDPITQSANLEIQRRADEMIQFGSSGPSS